MSLTEELTNKISGILSQSWDARDGRVVPNTNDIALGGGAVKLDATVLYADLRQSSQLATDFQQRTAGKVIKAFLSCMCGLVTAHNGSVTSFDGDRVMGVFLGNLKNTNAAKCALEMKYIVSKILKPQISNYFTSFRETPFDISHCVGIDTSSILAVRAGQRGSNDLVWVGRAPNLAAKLSEIREPYYSSYISEDVFSVLHESAKYGGDPRKLMWEQRIYTFLDEDITIYRSSWLWPP